MSWTKLRESLIEMIINLMLKHYKDDTEYKYEFRSMFLICLLEALEKWSHERGLEKLRTC